MGGWIATIILSFFRLYIVLTIIYRSSVRRYKHNEQKSRLVHLYRDRSIYFINDSKRYFAFDRISFHTDDYRFQFLSMRKMVRCGNGESESERASEQVSSSPRSAYVRDNDRGERWRRSFPFRTVDSFPGAEHANTDFAYTVLSHDYATR